MQTKTFTVKRKTFGGGFNTYQMTETNNWKGQELGTDLTDAHTLQTVNCDHYENEDADGIEIERNVWVKKSLVKSVTWQVGEDGPGEVLARIEFARPI